MWNPGLPALIRRRARDRDRIFLLGGGYTMPSIAAAMALLNLLGARWFFLSEKPGLTPARWKEPLRRAAIRALLGKRAGVLAHSPLAERYYLDLGVPRDRVDFLPYYMNADAFRAIERGAPPAAWSRERPLRLLYCGRLLPVKGIDWALAALNELRAEDAARVELTVAGEGPLRPALEAAAARSPLAGVRFLGDVAWDRRADVFAEADALVAPSRHDGFGMATMEALAAGLPVVATTAVGAAAACVRQGENGFLVEPESAGGLRDAIGRLLADPAATARMGEAARRSVAEWTPERGVARFKEILGMDPDRAGES